jgi:hypothetical protein
MLTAPEVITAAAVRLSVQASDSGWQDARTYADDAQIGTSPD